MSDSKVLSSFRRKHFHFVILLIQNFYWFFYFSQKPWFYNLREVWIGYPKQVCSRLQIFNLLVFAPKNILLFILSALIRADEILLTLTPAPIKCSCNAQIYGMANKKGR